MFGAYPAQLLIPTPATRLTVWHMEKDPTTPEDLLSRQIATCLAAMQDCLEKSRQPRRSDDTYDRERSRNLDYVASLMKASAKLTTALALLKGDTRHSQDIRVTRSVDKGVG